MKKLLLLLFISAGFVATSQEDEPSILNYTESGHFQLGMRTTTSVFGHDNLPGLGVGGQFRLQIMDYINTEWFADWITIDLNGAGTRKNAHIGWSVMFYPFNKGRFVPYAIAGHCFDYAEVVPFSTQYVDRSEDVVFRWSSAVQAGLGTHYYLSDRFNLTFSAQYMLHLGEHLDYKLHELSNGEYYLETGHAHGQDPHEAVGIEGHVLLTASLNYRIADFW